METHSVSPAIGDRCGFSELVQDTKSESRGQVLRADRQGGPRAGQAARLPRTLGGRPGPAPPALQPTFPGRARVSAESRAPSRRSVPRRVACLGAQTRQRQGKAALGPPLEREGKRGAGVQGRPLPQAPPRSRPCAAPAFRLRKVQPRSAAGVRVPGSFTPLSPRSAARRSGVGCCARSLRGLRFRFQEKIR